jgi:hypothetical protein
MKHRLAAILPAIAMAALAVPMTVATPAAAHANCGTGASHKDGGSWGKWADGANERSGSSTSCGIDGVAYSSQTLDYHRYTIGNDGRSRTYLGNDATGHLRLGP